MAKHLLVVLLILFSDFGFGQQPSYFRFAEKELEGIDIYDVIQDKEQNYYFATDQGIFMHDGYSFTKIECDAMSGGSVFHFVMNAEGVIYCHNLNKQIFQLKKGTCVSLQGMFTRDSQI
jgi:hypothetical protein